MDLATLLTNTFSPVDGIRNHAEQQLKQAEEISYVSALLIFALLIFFHILSSILQLYEQKTNANNFYGV